MEVLISTIWGYMELASFMAALNHIETAAFIMADGLLGFVLAQLLRSQTAKASVMQLLLYH